MRKLLLASLSGVLGVFGGADLARAQTPPPGTTYSIVPTSGRPTPPAPGTIAVSLGGLFQWFVGAYSADGNSYQGQKLSNYTTQGFARIYFGMDGQASNGILYGTQFQFRTNSADPSAGSSGRGAATVYLHSANAYIATPTIGKFMVGNGYATSPAGSMYAGFFDAFNDGGWNGDLEEFIPSEQEAYYPWLDNSPVYSGDKISYFSPTIAGFDVGVAWEPNYVALNDNNACANGAPGALSSCYDLSSSDVDTDAGKRKNTFDINGRYRGTFGPVGLLVSGGYIGSGTVDYTGIGQRYHGLGIAHVGTEVSFAGLTVGGNYMYGDQNGESLNLLPVGGAKTNAWLAGAQYETGPVLVGASYFNYQSQGDYSAPALEGQRVEYGIAAGGTYALTPGLFFFLSYLYGQRKQGGYDFLSAANDPDHNQVKSQAIGTGISLQW